MIVRQYRESDLGAVLDLHRKQGLDYELPPMSEMAASVLIEEGGNITHVLLLRRTLEAYWLFSAENEWKRQTLGRFLVLHKEGDFAAASEGFTDVHAFIPPQVADKKMDLTMLKLGWRRPLWTCYHRPIVPVLVEV